MLSRSAKRISSTSSTSARAGIRNLVLGSGQGEEAVYSSKTFEDGDASPSPGGTPLSSRRPSMTAGFAARRESQTGRAPFAMTSISDASPAPSRTISTTAAASATVLPGISAVPMDASNPIAPQSPTHASYEHGSYEFTPKELAAVKKRVEEEFLLKKAVSSSQGLASQIRPSGKVPYEFTDSSSSSRMHPSGFVVPAATNGADSHVPPIASTLLEGESRQRWRQADATEGVREGVRSFEGLKGFDTFGTSTRSGKVPQEMLLADGSAVHSSGFVPPSRQEASMEGVKDRYKPAVRAH